MRRLVVSAPGRANLIGNPTDIYGGAVLSCSVGLRARVVLEESPGLELVTGGDRFRVAGPEDLELRGDLFDLGRAVLAHRGLDGLGCRISYESEIPRQSGLGGSSALMVALLQGVLAWQHRELDRYELAESARRVELTLMKIVCGFVDQYMGAFGGLRYLDFRGKALDRDRACEPQPFATVETLEAEQLPFLLAYTGVEHSSSAVHSPIRERWLAGEAEVVAGYERVTEIAGLGKRAFLARDWQILGRLMNENHAIQRGFGGSGESNERLIAAALRAGAPGAKLAGAGDGGTIVAVCPESEAGVKRLEAELRDAGASALYRLRVDPGVHVE
jgi:galactokinase/mevalonate kinase-like predicted kinase